MPKIVMETANNEIKAAWHKLQLAVSSNEANPSYCLRLWSKFIRLRDGQRCVICHSRENLSAHHIVRKSFIPNARFQTGNGITLCKTCHKEPHTGFNRRPNLDFPMDAEGGEKIDLLMDLFGALLNDATSRNLLNDDYYYLSDEVLMISKAFQSIPREEIFLGSRLEQAFRIWQQCPRRTLYAVIEAALFDLPDDFI
jgi:hypothetical protein